MSQFSRIILGGHSVGFPYGKQPRSRAKLFAFVLLIVALAAIFAWDAYGAGLDDCYRATCRIHTGFNGGTGCVYAENSERYYILTNAHVVGTRRGATVRVTLCREGYEGSVPGTVEWGVRGRMAPDVAVVSILRSSLGGYEPPVIPLAPDDAVRAGNTVRSVGSANGAWVSGWTGHVTRSDRDYIEFLPVPEPGRSGSAIFSEDGSSIVGLVTWSMGNRIGIGQTASVIRNAIRRDNQASNNRAVYSEAVGPLTPIQRLMPPYCQGGHCEQGGGMQYQPPQQNNPWPNLPHNNKPQATPPATEPAQPAAKGCECKPHEPCQCDQAAVAKIGDELNGLKTQITGLVDAVAKLSEKPANPPLVPPVVQPDVPPQIKPAEVHHHVVVADLSAPGWPRVAGEVEQARDVFSAIHVVDAKDVPFVVRPLPQFVTYDADGKAIAIAKGERETSLALQRIYRRE